ncbi:MAG: osmoprotectant transport system substrate-binding protein opuBD [Sphingomonadales bacterium]|jgi:osmoprotectant transport system permease protein|nr:osmoprotectant transport system substrate-binding protein opuBD [Sphingomonadales bacterium]
MTGAAAEALAALPDLVRAHILLSCAALAIAIAAGLPLAFWAAGHPRARVPLLAAVGLVQTIPSLALLALFYPLLLMVDRATSLALPALGFLPSLIALSLYALLPIVRNGVAAREGLDPAVLEAADGVGMTRRQRLLLVELPLGAPVLLAGIRTAAVWTIGAATLATTVGQPSLGNLIFSGLQTENWVRVLVGCAAAALLAIVADALLALIESGLARLSAVRTFAGLGLLAAALIASQIHWAPRQDRPLAVIGAKNFSEQYILAAAIADRLAAAGYRTEIREDLGSAIAYRALAAGDIDVYVDYGGTLWTNVLARSDNPPAPILRAELARRLARRDGVGVLGPLGFENAYALAMRRDRAERLHVRSIEDLSAAAPQLHFASDIEFLSRPEWRSVAAAYRLQFAGSRSYSPTFMYRAVADGSADVISAFSSDGRIAALDLVTLADPRRALPSYEALLLVSPRRAQDAAFLAALRPLVGAVPIGRMRQANLMVDRDRDKKSPAEAARWLLPPSPPRPAPAPRTPVSAPRPAPPDIPAAS